MSNTVCITEEISKITWEWMKLTENISQGRATETGLTSYLIYKMSQSTGYNKLLTFDNTKYSTKEKVTGADFYLALPRSNEKYLVQAKRMYNKKSKPDILENTYDQFDHKITFNNNSIFQFQILIDY